jgi:hypothetical protein
MPGGVVGERVSLPLGAGGLEGHHELLHYLDAMEAAG